MARHLTLEERERVSQMVHARCSQAEIARRLKRHPATISRELRRTATPTATGRRRPRSRRMRVQPSALDLQNGAAQGRQLRASAAAAAVVAREIAGRSRMIFPAIRGVTSSANDLRLDSRPSCRGLLAAVLRRGPRAARGKPRPIAGLRLDRRASRRG